MYMYTAVDLLLFKRGSAQPGCIQGAARVHPGGSAVPEYRPDPLLKLLNLVLNLVPHGGRCKTTVFLLKKKLRVLELLSFDE